MSPLPHCVIVLIVVGAFNNAGATPANQDFQKIMDALQDVVKDAADCNDSVLKVDKVLRSQQTTLGHLLSSTAHQLQQQCQPISNELAFKLGEYKNKLEVAEQQIQQMEGRLLQVETASRTATEKSQYNEGKLQALEKKMDQAASKNPCRSPFYQVGDDCLYVDHSLRLSWHKCRHFCGVLGGDLAVPSDVLVLRDFLTSLSVQTEWGYWIGGSDLKKEGSWLWVDGRQVDLSVGWGRGQPDNAAGNEHCLHYWEARSFILNDYQCNKELCCVCQDANYLKKLKG